MKFSIALICILLAMHGAEIRAEDATTTPADGSSESPAGPDIQIPVQVVPASGLALPREVIQVEAEEPVQVEDALGEKKSDNPLINEEVIVEGSPATADLVEEEVVDEADTDDNRGLESVFREAPAAIQSNPAATGIDKDSAQAGAGAGGKTDSSSSNDTLTWTGDSVVITTGNSTGNGTKSKSDGKYPQSVFVEMVTLLIMGIIIVSILILSRLMKRRRSRQANPDAVVVADGEVVAVTPL